MAEVSQSPYTETEHLRERVKQLADGLHARLDEISVSEYPNETPKLVVRVVREIIDEALKYAETSGRPVLQVISELLMVYSQLLSFLDNAHTEQTPRALTGMLEWLYRRLGSDPTLLACPQSDYNYSISDLLQYLKETSKNLLSAEARNAIFGDIPHIKLISFPRIERDNVLLHAIFGHEVGHPFADDFLREEELGEHSATFQDALRRMTQRIETEFAETIKQSKNFPGQIDVRTALVGRVLQIRRRGLQELLSDAVAVQIFGPSAIFAAHEIFMPSGLDSPPSDASWYPPDRYRIRLMIDVSKRLGQWETLSRVAPEIRPSVEYLEGLASISADKQALEYSTDIRIAYDWIEEVLPDAISFVLARTGAALYAPQQIADQVPRLIRRLSLGIPPNELGPATAPTKVDWRSSVLAAWIFRFRKLGTGDLDFRRVLMTTRKAIEYVLLREAFDKASRKTEDGDHRSV